ncbi:endo-1,4-beta-xylanase [Sediminibacterium soli]|uniref:endo-1,4-beta-xylanase n=1 Tax=Sediminibacterium soli TaxID=2698829 RepID=UPI00137A3B13|nr:endo-1,4-beta-xylanase [Sediminibacterium soli]NCI45734.1 endo-1,4-beta-xylanase [Sediminibacterium soli]
MADNGGRREEGEYNLFTFPFSSKELNAMNDRYFFTLIPMKKRLPALLCGLSCLLAISCKKSGGGTVAGGSTVGGGTVNQDTVGTLKSVANAGFPFGLAIEYALFKQNEAYANLVKREASVVTFGYQMKHGAIVKDDGSFNFSGADELLTLCSNAGLEVYGHTLAWHQNQNGNYLRSLTTGGSGGPNLLPSGDLEAGSSGTGSTLFTGWNCLVGGTASANFAAVAGNNSARAMQVTVTTPGANAYDVQSIGTAFTANTGSVYRVSVDIKASVANGKVRLVMQNTAYQQLDITPTAAWDTYSWNVTVNESSPMLRLNFPASGTYTIDNISITDLSSAPPPAAAQVTTAVDSAMSRFIRTMVTRYAGKVKAWDVVNEPMMDGSSGLRTNTGTTTGDLFYWSQYLGRDYALKAFQYAKAADPNALLFINEYNLESNTAKLDSLIAYVNELKAKGAKIDGIGTQMHIGINTATSGIDNAFKKLAATGLKLRVSELDVRINPGDNSNFTAGPSELTAQANMYRYVLNSFLQNVPQAQRHGFTVWGVADSDSWILTSQKKTDAPLLFDNNYGKKQAFYSLLLGLKGK